MKRCAKKEACRERQEMIRNDTGGGKPSSLPPESEEATDWLRSLMSGSIDGNEPVYDDYVMIPKSHSVGYLWMDTIKVICQYRGMIKNKNSESVIKQALRKKKLSVLEGLHDLELEKIKQSISQQKELHEQLMRHNEEKHKLELLKLQLEIDALKEKSNQ